MSAYSTNDRAKWVLVNRVYFVIRAIFQLLTWYICRECVIRGVESFRYLSIILIALILITYLIASKVNNKINVLNDIQVVEILKKPYKGVEFEGYNNINLTFQELEVIVKNNVDEWKRKLENITGIYMLLDRSNGKKYIGSAYGQEGIWQRWSSYIYSQNGGNKELLQLDNDYIRKNFNFTLLEWYVIGTDIEFIISRENYWKQVMMSKKADGFGYNDN